LHGGAHFVGTSVAEDNGGASKADPKSAAQRLREINPDIVVINWPAPAADVTRAVRAHPNVKEYILIGETDASTCGHHWDTWGSYLPFAMPMQLASVFNPTKLPAPFEAEGFSRRLLPELSKLQVCRHDSPFLRSLDKD
jgi:hypothetical protein